MATEIFTGKDTCPSDRE